jgi:hypothetical protein
MTPTSLLPRAARAAGMEFAALLDRLVDLALANHAARARFRPDERRKRRFPHMKVLVVGRRRQRAHPGLEDPTEPRVEKVFCAPGNGGIAEMAACVDIDPENVPALVEFARGEGIDLTVVGPEGPLSAGIVDAFEAADSGFSVRPARRRKSRRANPSPNR